MKINIFLSVLIAYLAFNKTYGCSCMPPYYNNFCDAITLHPLTSKNNDIVLARVDSFTSDYTFAYITILHKLKCDLSDKRYVIAGQDGLNCALELYAGHFYKGDTVIFNLLDALFHNEDTLEVNNCSLSFLNYSNDTIYGNINQTETRLRYSEFITLLSECISEEIAGLENFNNNRTHEILIFPNPTKDFIKIRGRKIKSVEIINSTGQLVNIIEINDDELFIDLKNVNEGIYFVKITMNENRVIFRKILKE